MLDILRKHSRSFLIYLVFTILIIVFAFTFGAISPDQACGGRGGPGSTAVVAEVDGREVGMQDVAVADALSYSPPSPRNNSQNAGAYMQRYQATRLGQLGLTGPYSGARFGRDPREIGPIKFQKLVDELVETRLVAQYAREHGMSITNEEMSQRLTLLTEQFKSEETGEFDETAWNNFIRGSLQTGPPAFEAFVKEELLRERVIELMVGAVSASQTEIEAEHKLSAETVKVEYVTFDKRSVAPFVPVAGDELDNWIAGHQEQIAAAYDKKKDTDYTTPKKWSLRVIKLDAPDVEAAAADATPEQKTALEAQRAEAKTKAEALRTELATALEAAKAEPVGEDGVDPVTKAFATFAEANSTAPSKATGGLLAQPVSEKDLGAPPFGAAIATAVPTLADGELSGVLETPDAFWIVRVEGTMPAVTKTLDDVRLELGKSLLRDEKAEAFAATLADAVLAEAKKDPAKKLADVLAEVAKQYPGEGGKALEVKESQPFSRLKSYGPGLPTQVPFIGGVGQSADFVKAAFAASEAQPVIDISEAIEPYKHRVVARFLEKKAAEPLTADEKKEIEERLTFEKQRRIYRGWYESYLAAKMADGDVELTSDYQEQLRQEQEAYRQSGGVLPGDIPPQGEPQTTSTTP
ncbi:MAG: SurA N-terminal domain-containing protein [Myxococcales bacterium]|nr:SurA N-terminal domain-containing protein [Myxococcales bacterium]MCB9736759.1 SurA N-terminal domain-containing protein [Deltaproteobacteria bacterium]